MKSRLIYDPRHIGCGARAKLGLLECTCEKCGPVPHEEIRVNLIVYTPGSIAYSDGI
jgi:hypothetical protein